MNDSQGLPSRPADSRVQERAMLTGCVLDAGIMLAMLIAAIWSNSLSTLAELMRGVPLWALEVLLLFVMMRINRGQMAAYDYGTRKIEQFANLVAGLLLLFGALWLVARLLSRAGVPQDQPSTGLAFAAAVAAMNLAINVWIFVQVWRAARGGNSLILNGQIKVRLSKTLASAFVALAIAANAVLGSEGLGGWADIAGTAVVVLVMLVFGGQMVAEAMPHLVDRALGEQQQALINRVLAARFDEYDDLLAVRTRTEGRSAWIEIELGFLPDRTVAQTTAVADRVAAEVRDLVPGAHVLVLIRGLARPAGTG